LKIAPIDLQSARANPIEQKYSVLPGVLAVFRTTIWLPLFRHMPTCREYSDPRLST